MWVFEEERDPIPELNKLITPVTKEEKGKIRTSWKTPYGVTFYSGSGLEGIYFYEYDSDLSDLFDNDCNGGALSGNDILKSLEILEKDPNKLRTKPNSILKLEKIIGKPGFRHQNGFGKWRFFESGKYSLFNNPFGCSLGYCDTEDDFEIFFFRKNEDPYERQSIESVVSLLRGKGYIK